MSIDRFQTLQIMKCMFCRDGASASILFLLYLLTCVSEQDCREVKVFAVLVVEPEPGVVALPEVGVVSQLFLAGQTPGGQ